MTHENKEVSTEQSVDVEEPKAGFSIDTIVKLSPFILALPPLAGGIVGGLCGGIGWYINDFVFKKEIAKPLKYGAALLNLIFCFGLYLVIAMLIMMIFPSMGE